MKPHPRNPNTHPDEQIRLLAKIIKETGWRSPVVVSARSGYVVKGHGRLLAARHAGFESVPVDVQDYVDEAQELADLVADNRIAELAEMDLDALGDILGDLYAGDADMDLTGFDDWMPDMGEAEGLTDEDDVPEDVPPVCQRGQVWKLGDHRLMCGDSTSSEDVAALMGGKAAALLHADPPYGMGKEADGVVNDNLYAEKLDAFQMDWWRAFRPALDDNATAYIWGNAPELWRLWYSGGLKESERLTFRNEIVWNKSHGQGMESDQHRMYPTASERALFFMLGEQGFNVNADNYWKGWEPIRKYLKDELAKVGDIKWAKRAAGHSEKSGCHWFDSSQWTMPTEKVYKAWQTEARDSSNELRAFKRDYESLKRDYESLKRDFYATRAFFDNTHDNMTDVWDFGRVTGEERHGHATPKPVAMMERVMKSSLPPGGLCVEPFGGSGSTLIGAEKTGRACYTMELQEKYCDVIIKRWEDFTGKKAVLVDA